jgi:large subunit ribosomal protein L29
MKSKEDLSGLTIEELQQKLIDVRQELENLSVQKATHQLNNPVRIRFVRREIARIKTLIHQHELGTFTNKNQDN